MAIDINVQMGQIAEQIKAELRKRMQNAASKVADELTMAAQNAMSEYYSWSPVLYSRTGAMMNTYSRLYHNHGDAITCGVRLTPPGAYPNYNGKKSVSGQFVFQLAYSGRHGNTATFPWASSIVNWPPTMSPSPINMIMDKRDEVIGKIDSYF